jgi:hypothetical protein
MPEDEMDPDEFVAAPLRYTMRPAAPESHRCEVPLELVPAGRPGQGWA